MATAIVLMGVSGSGKTAVGRALAARLGWPFHDGDDHHATASVEKMARGIPLDDADRRPWLERLRLLIADHLDRGRSLVVAASALRATYRAALGGDRDEVRFVHLTGDPDLILARLASRSGHYIAPGMLRSQLAALEPPRDALTIPIDQPIEAITTQIVERMGLAGAGAPS